VQRRPLIGALRALGVTRTEIFALVMSEALVIGAVGTLLGVGLGFGMAQGLLRLVTRTIYDLYFVLSVREVVLDPLTLAKSVLLGIGATALASLPPALEATAAPPRVVMSRASLETGARRRARRAGWLGLVVLAAGALILAAPGGIGVGVMIASFREAVTAWLEGTLRADVYVSAPSLVGSRPDATLDPELVARLGVIPGVVRASTSRGVVVQSPRGPAQVVALDVDPSRPPRWRFRSGGDA